jgi:hypothetical protein
MGVFCLWLNLAFAQAGKKLALDACDFSLFFHKVGARVNVTTLRHELKAVVEDSVASNFLKRVEHIVGDDRLARGARPRVSLRDVPDNVSDAFVTNTDYLPVVHGVDASGKTTFSGVIRIRNYLVVPKESSVKSVDSMSKLRYSKLANGDELFAKLEFKIGHPELDAAGLLSDQPGVVDKPGITLARRDIDLLLKSPESFEQHRDEILERGLALRLTQKNGSAVAVNDPQELKDMIDRIGKVHRSEIGNEFNKPVVNIRYKRTARKISFKDPSRKLPNGEAATFEVQLTVDEDIRLHDFETGEIVQYRPEQRIVELKIPTEYASLSNEELRRRGLGELADLREAYDQLPVAEGTERNRGKRSTGQGLLRENSPGTHRERR